MTDDTAPDRPETTTHGAEPPGQPADPPELVWQPASLSNLAGRLREVRELLSHAAALAAVTELERARSLADLVQQDPRARAPVRLLPRNHP
jgi:hypothetical protein